MQTQQQQQQQLPQVHYHYYQQQATPSTTIQFSPQMSQQIAMPYTVNNNPVKSPVQNNPIISSPLHPEQQLVAKQQQQQQQKIGNEEEEKQKDVSLSPNNLSPKNEDDKNDKTLQQQQQKQQINVPSWQDGLKKYVMDLMRKGNSFNQIFEELNKNDDNDNVDKLLYLAEKKGMFQAYESTLQEIQHKKLLQAQQKKQQQQSIGINEVRNLQFELEPSTARLFEEAAKTSSPPQQLKRKRKNETILLSMHPQKQSLLQKRDGKSLKHIRKIVQKDYKSNEVVVKMNSSQRAEKKDSLQQLNLQQK